MTPRPRPLADGFAPYIWASQPDAIAAKHGIDPAIVIRYDANVPALPGVPPIPLGKSFARLNEYPEGSYRELRLAAAAYAGVSPQQVTVGAGADGLIHLVARTFLWHGRRAGIVGPTYPLYQIAGTVEGAETFQTGFDAAALRDADVVWLCNPNNPSGELRDPEAIVALANALPDAVVVVDEAYIEYAIDGTVVPLLDGAPNLVVLRTLSKAFGFAALRVGYAVSSEELAGVLTSRREPAPVSTPAARIAAAALHAPRLDVESAIAERERMRRALLDAGFECPPSAGSFVYVPTPDAAEIAERLESQGLVIRRFPGALRITVRLPAENDRVLAALGAAPEPSSQRTALVIRTTTETALRVALSLDGQGRARIETGIGFLDHMLQQVAFHGGFDLEVIAGGDVDVDEHHTVEDVLAALGDALAEALGAREGITRYGAAAVPMDEARATAVVDLVKRPHAEIDLRFGGERVGGLALTLLPHALERFAMQARLTLHVDASGEDDHHVVEAAFKALGRALRDACSTSAGAGVRSTKGEA